MGYHDGKSFYALDFSLHGEKGKNAQKPYGLSKEEYRNRYTKPRPPESAGGKRVHYYETTGELFRQSQKGTLELTVYERIWQILIDIIHELAEMTGADIELLMENLLSENERFMKLINYRTLLNAS